MTLGRVLPLPVAKEVRALLPVWLGCLAVAGAGAAGKASGFLNEGGVHDTGLLALAGACVTIGALSVGHEYADRTLPLLLSQPGSRARVFLVKQAVLSMMLGILAITVWSTLLVHSSVNARLVALSVLGGLFVAPWMTMCTRDPLGGAILSTPAAGWIWILIDVAVQPPLKIVAFAWGILALCAICGVLGWRAFMRLEVIEGRGASVHLGRAATGLAAARARNPIWLLVKKELSLQQLTFVVVALYLAAWVIVSLVGTPQRQLAEDLFGAMTILYSGILALLIGSLASAEERHLGTLEWQVLLPMASGTQGAIKAAVAVALSMLFGVTLPALLLWMSGGHVRINEPYAGAILLVTIVSLYVSSLVSSGLRALLLSVPVSVAALALLMRLLGPVEKSWGTPPAAGLFALVLAVMLYLALVNHRSAERGAWRVCVQVFCLAGCLAFGAAFLAVFAR